MAPSVGLRSILADAIIDLSQRIPAREESWNSVYHSDTAGEMDEDGLIASRRLSTVGEVRRALNPLQEQADRVGRQVEQFAETLDRLNPLRDASGTGAAAALPLIQEYERIAGETVSRLKRKHGEERRQLLKQARRRLNHVSGALIQHPDESEEDLEVRTSVKDLIHWEQEQQTWELLGLMLQVNHPITPGNVPTDYIPLERPAPTPVHRYSSDSAVYRNFLATDDTSWEKHVVTQWLSRAADAAQEDVYEIVEDSFDAQGDTEALTAHGWIRAKETIKQQKRLRSWNQPLDPSAQEVNALFAGKGQSGPVVTQLDPDAPTRQKRSLPTEDLAFERAIWIGCWELIKRGRPWIEVLDWCKERAETWRALSLRPDLSLKPEDGETGGDFRGRAFWQQTCLQLATTGGVDDYERAVYGLFGGDDKSVFKVCETWDEYLYGLLSCQVIQRYNTFFCQKFNMPPVISSTDLTGSSPRLQDLLDRLASNPETRKEALSSFKALQSSIMTGTITEFVTEQGSQLSAHLRKARYGSLGNSNEPVVASSKTRPASELTPAHHDMIRILAHVVLAYGVVDATLATNSAAENIVVAYIDYLGKAGKQQLLPLYASRLSKDRAAVCMARQLIYIKDTSERQTVMRLMRQFDMEQEIILFAQLSVVMTDAPASPQYQTDFPKLTILDTNRVADSDIASVKKGFMGHGIQDWQADLIDALEWFLISEGDWNETFSAGTIVYKHFLRTKAWSAASELARRISYSRISLMKSRKTVGREVDLSEILQNGEIDNHVDDDDAMDHDSETASTRRLKAQAQKDQLLKNSRTFQDLENFVRAIDAISQWQGACDAGLQARVQAQKGDKGPLKDWTKDLLRAHEAVHDAVGPLLHGWLMSPKDDAEAIEASQLRIRMLPEVVIAYLSIQAFGGRFLHRDQLLQCMNLARTIADPDSSDLCDAFVEAGRMAELVTVLAGISQQILDADESTGTKPMSKKRRGEGELLDIWSIGAED